MYDAPNPGGGIGAGPNAAPTANILSSDHPFEALETQGHAASVSAALLTDYANILIDQLEPLAAP